MGRHTSFTEAWIEGDELITSIYQFVAIGLALYVEDQEQVLTHICTAVNEDMLAFISGALAMTHGKSVEYRDEARIPK